MMIVPLPDGWSPNRDPVAFRTLDPRLDENAVNCPDGVAVTFGSALISSTSWSRTMTSVSSVTAV